MEHAITIGEVLIVVGVVGAVFGFAAICLALIWATNPFRSGH